MVLLPIGHMRSPYATKFGVPRQPGLVRDAACTLELDGPDCIFEDLTWIEPEVRCILLWAFSHNVGDPEKWSKTVRPPLLGGTKRVGVFATRSSFRPNNLALTCATIRSFDNARIEFQGCDLVDGTPVFSVLPYDLNAQSIADASEGWRGNTPWPTMSQVIIPARILDKVPSELHRPIYDLLRQDPRPAYTRSMDQSREFWVPYDRFAIRFQCRGKILIVTDAVELSPEDVVFLKRTGNIPAIDRT